MADDMEFGAGMLYTLEDEEGNEAEFELLDEMEYNGAWYCALVPFHEDEEEILDDDGEFIVLKREMIDGEEMLCTIDEDDEYETVGNLFLERLNAFYDDDELDEDEALV